MLGVIRVGNSKVSEYDGHFLCAVIKADTVLTAQTRVSGGRKSNCSKLICHNYLAAIPELLHPVF